MNRAVIVLAAAGLTSAANAQNFEDLILVDLSVANQITITATAGNSANDASGADGTGILLADFFTAGNDSGGFISDLSFSGGFTNFENPSDGSPDIFRNPSSNGLNFWSFSSDTTVTFTAGGQAFTGSATFDLDADDYADMINSVSVGDRGVIFFPADTDDDIAGAVALGNWVVVPTPGTAALLALGGLAAARRRR